MMNIDTQTSIAISAMERFLCDEFPNFRITTSLICDSDRFMIEFVAIGDDLRFVYSFKNINDIYKYIDRQEAYNDFVKTMYDLDDE